VGRNQVSNYDQGTSSLSPTHQHGTQRAGSERYREQMAKSSPLSQADPMTGLKLRRHFKANWGHDCVDNINTRGIRDKDALGENFLSPLQSGAKTFTPL